MRAVLSRFPQCRTGTVQVICAFRLLSQEVDLSLSTREHPAFRDNVCKLGITTMSAGSKTNPGGYSVDPQTLEQFEICDERSPAEFAAVLRTAGYEVVWKDWDPTYDAAAGNIHESAKQGGIGLCRNLVRMNCFTSGIGVCPFWAEVSQVEDRGAGYWRGRSRVSGIALAAAGVGRIAIIDDDTVDLSNLHGKLYTAEDIGQRRQIAARSCKRRTARVHCLHGSAGG